MNEPQPASSLEGELIRDIARFTHDPLGHVLYVYPWGKAGTSLEGQTGPRKWQREVLESIGAKLKAGARSLGEIVQEACASGHGIGKSALMAWIVKWALDTHEEARGIITANTETQLRTKTWPELTKWHNLAITRHWFTLTASALYSAHPRYEKTWRFDAIPWSEHNTEAFAGLHNKGKRIVLLFDEASAIADKVWEVAEGALTDEDTEIVWAAFGNPTRTTGRFRDCFGKLRHRWGSRQIDSRTVEGTNKAQLQKWVEDYGEDSDFVKIRVRGMFPAASAKQFISTADVDAAFGRHLRPDQYSWAPKILTCDPAWSGDDELVIGLRQGLAFRILLTLPKNDNDVHVATVLARFEDDEKADAVFVDGGYGTGIVSVGRTWKREWTLVWFSGQSADPGCVNKRAEMWNAGRRWLKEGGAIPADNVLYADLIGPETVPRLDGKILIEPKEAMKLRGLPSPNRGDALMLSFAAPVQARNAREPLHEDTGTPALDYDPLHDTLRQ